MCVAMSRAKHGFFCIGNLQMLAKVNPMWSEIVGLARQHNIISSKLKLTCHSHFKNDIEVNSPSQFDLRPEGGCKLACQKRLKCGHTCPRLCHPADRDHVKYKCAKPCFKVIAWCGHNCQQPCSHPGECEECSVKISKLLKICGHQVMVRWVTIKNRYS